jgi:hypothetical protein
MPEVDGLTAGRCSFGVQIQQWWSPIGPMPNRFIILVGLVLVPWLGCGGDLTSTVPGAVSLGVIQDRKLDEISGVAASRRTPGVLWMHNDGLQPRFFAVLTNGQRLATFALRADVDDLEDIASGPGPRPGDSCLYLGDIGDNKRIRRIVRVLRFVEPAMNRVPAGSRAEFVESFETLLLRYPGGPNDAEALMVDPLSGDLFIVTKERKRARVFRAAQLAWMAPGPVQLELVAELKLDHVSGADISADGTRVLLRREGKAWLWSRRADESIALALLRSPEKVPVIGPPIEANGEAIAFATDGSGYFTVGEGRREGIFFFPLPIE